MRNYYAGLNGYGIGITFTSNGWTAYRFDSKTERDAWVEAHQLSREGNIITQAITYKDALAITGATKAYPMVDDQQYSNESAVRVVKSS